MSGFFDVIGRTQSHLDATGQKWVRFAAWDVATNGALVQPIRLF